MSRKKRRNSWKIRVPFSVLQSVADALLDGPERILADGLSLQPSSALWRKKDGTLTARLVYRPSSAAARMDSFVVTIRHIALVDAVEDAPSV